MVLDYRLPEALFKISIVIVVDNGNVAVVEVDHIVPNCRLVGQISLLKSGYWCRDSTFVL